MFKAFVTTPLVRTDNGCPVEFKATPTNENIWLVDHFYNSAIRSLQLAYGFRRKHSPLVVLAIVTVSINHLTVECL